LKPPRLNLLDRLKAALVVAWYGAYEATKRSPDRSFIPPIVLDAHLDLDSATRIDLISKCQHLERNDGIYNKLVDVWEQYTTGSTGLPCTPASSDEEWNLRRAESFNKWCENCELSGQNISTTESLASRRWFVDGQCLILKTFESIPGPPKMQVPRIQLIESHRIGTPPGRTNDEGKIIFDGIQTDALRRRQTYWIRDGSDPDKYVPRSAAEIIHIFEPHRPGMLHGLPIATCVINDLIDLRNLKYLEMLAAKDAAEKSTVIKTESGEVSAGTLRAQRLGNTAIDSQGNEISEQQLSLYKKVLGARTIALKKGESAEQFRVERPSGATQAHWDILLQNICSGTGISKLLAFPGSMQGTVVRVDVECAAAFFKSRSAVMAQTKREIYLFHLEWDVANNPALKNKPADWRAVTIRPPRAPNVDVGRNSRAMLSELVAGASNYDLIYAPLGLDAYEELRKSARFAKYIHDLADEFGVTAIEIASHATQTIGTLEPQTPKPAPKNPALANIPEDRQNVEAPTLKIEINRPPKSLLFHRDADGAVVSADVIESPKDELHAAQSLKRLKSPPKRVVFNRDADGAVVSADLTEIEDEDSPL
jgi:capsid protein